MTGTDAIQIVAKIVRWGKRGAKIRKFGNGSNNSKSKPRSNQRLLVDQARAYGFINGKRIERKK